MSKPRYGWWGYVKWMIRQTPKRDGMPLDGKAAEEQAAVYRALKETMNKPDANARLMLIDLVFFKQTHTLDGAAQAVASCLYTQIPESRINTELFNHHQKTEYPYNHTENAF